MLVTLQRNRYLLAFASSVVFLLLVAFPVFAQVDPITGGFNVAQNIGEGALGTADLRDIIVNIVNVALGFLGIIAVIIIIYSGYLWMTSGGNQEQIDRAKSTLRNAIIGLFIIIASWAIVAWFVSQFIAGTGGLGGPGGGGNIGNGALGAGIIQSVYPPPNANGIPRNTKIFVTFKEAMNPNSIIDGGDVREVGLVPVVEITNLTTGIVLTGAEVQAEVTPDNKQFVFTPLEWLGSPNQPEFYSVALHNDIEKADLSPAFGSVTGIGFLWNFAVSTIVDLTPPILVNLNPKFNTTNPRNVIIQMVFSEAINPISITPVTIEIRDLSSGLITGTLFQGANYRTVEFLPDAECDNQPLNTCGEPVYCLPANTIIESLVKAAGLSGPPAGIEDAAGNSFDGNRNAISDGPGFGPPFDMGDPDPDQALTKGDNAFWQFDTNDTIDLKPPAVIERVPNSQQATPWPIYDRLSIKFDKLLSVSTLLPDGSYGNGKEYVTLVDPRQQVGYYVTGSNGNGCSTFCLNQGSSSAFGSVCGADGDNDFDLVDQGEDCDYGDTRAGDGCSSQCLNEGTGNCGDGLVTHHEECDTAVEPWLSQGGCSVQCQFTGSPGGPCPNIAASNCCGNGIVEPGEACDDSTNTQCSTSSCLYLGAGPASCGNGRIDYNLGENCDDANNKAGDGCSTNCLLEGARCGDGSLDIGEDCDTPGVSFCNNFCQNAGNPFTCESGTIEIGEDCDLGPLQSESYAFITHTGFAESSDYGVRLGSGIRDTFQNCFLPSAETAPLDGGSYGDCNTVQDAGYIYGYGPVAPWDAPPVGDFPSCLRP
jgi:cysteine-rich repeat protein